MAELKTLDSEPEGTTPPSILISSSCKYSFKAIALALNIVSLSNTEGNIFLTFSSSAADTCAPLKALITFNSNPLTSASNIALSGLNGVKSPFRRPSICPVPCLSTLPKILSILDITVFLV